MGFLKSTLPPTTLIFIAPVIAEYLLGSMPVAELPRTIIFVMPIYGFGALLIREITRQTGRGWPTIVALAFAYAALEEGVATHSLFNPNWNNLRLSDYGFIPALGMGSVLTTFILSLHVVWSICVPIGLVELMYFKRRTQPWLGKVGLAITAVLYAFGIAMLAAYFTRDFSAQPFQYAIIAAFVAAGLAVGLLVFRPNMRAPEIPGKAPSPWALGSFSFVATTIAMLFWIFGDKTWHVPAAVTVMIVLALDIAGLILVFRAARQGGWSHMHRFALVAGASLTYCWTGPYIQWIQHGGRPLVSQIALSTAFIVFLVFVGVELQRDRYRQSTL